ncbi:MAG: thioredoxin family protein [Bacteroidales bacterium]|nr:thioredoxin family protein [Bacteroidales bacterium]
MKQIKVLVSGCQCSRKFYDLVVKVAKENGIEAEVLMVDDIMEIMQYNTMTLPSLVVDEKLVARGQQSEAAIKSLLI